MLASIIIRTLNEEKHLDELLSAIETQVSKDLRYEVIIVDSGSTDETLSIAKAHGAKIVHISRDEFSFGRALNIGCEEAKGELLIMISGHCVPTDSHWLVNLCLPLVQQHAEYSYGKQIGGPASNYSECQIFSKYYPEISKVPQEGYFCNNANAALTRDAWEKYRFDEELTGLEDMALAQKIVNDGGYIAYTANSCVYHYHDESWKQVKRRFERESIALREIMPQVHIRKRDIMRYVITSIYFDFRAASVEGRFFKKAIEIIKYRFFQYWGSFVGNHEHRKLSHEQKEAYFYPNQTRRKHESKSSRTLANESK